MTKFIAKQIHKCPNTKWRVLGIDPAPSNPSCVCFFDGEKLIFESFEVHELHQLLNILNDEPHVLITWDAPLTGPPLFKPGEAATYKKGDFTQRTIEAFFMRDSDVFKKQKGISTQGYSGCQHWTITKTLTGLPILGPYCQRDNLPFHHIESTKMELREDKPNIVEVHPALAMYLWLRGDKGITSWRYKGNRENAKNKSERCKLVYKKLKDKFNLELEGIHLPESVENGDKLDAFIAWVLGYFYALHNGTNKEKQVEVLGDEKKGSMLLPRDEDVFKGFSAFCS